MCIKGNGSCFVWMPNSRSSPAVRRQILTSPCPASCSLLQTKIRPFPPRVMLRHPGEEGKWILCDNNNFGSHSLSAPDCPWPIRRRGGSSASQCSKTPLLLKWHRLKAWWLPASEMEGRHGGVTNSHTDMLVAAHFYCVCGCTVCVAQ